MPAGHGKSFLGLIVAALLIHLNVINKVQLVYHEGEIMQAEKEHIQLLKSKFGAHKVEAILLKDVPNKTLTLTAKTLVVLDEADWALID